MDNPIIFWIAYSSFENFDSFIDTLQSSEYTREKNNRQTWVPFSIVVKPQNLLSCFDYNCTILYKTCYLIAVNKTASSSLCAALCTMKSVINTVHSVLRWIKFKGYWIQTLDLKNHDPKWPWNACRNPSSAITQHLKNNHAAVISPLPKLTPFSSQNLMPN